jgi:hypothetical protein
MAILTICGSTITAWAAATGAGQHPRPASALAHLTCRAFRANQQVEIQGGLAAPQNGTYTAVAQRTCGRLPGDSRTQTKGTQRAHVTDEDTATH